MRLYYTMWLYAVLLASLVAAAVQSAVEERRILSESTARLSSLAFSIEESVLNNFNSKKPERIARSLEKLQLRQKVMGAALCAFNPDRSYSVQQSVGVPRDFGWGSLCQSAHFSPSSDEIDWNGTRNGARVQYYAVRMAGLEAGTGSLILLLARDTSYIRGMWIESFTRTFALTFLAGVALLLLVTAQIQRWVKTNFLQFRTVLRSIIAGRKPRASDLGSLEPISKDLDRLADKVLAARPTSSRSLARSLREIMGHKQLVVIANREPYIHQRRNQRVDVVRPASGLVTALEPILRQSGGLWIAHGSGSADFEVVDDRQEVAVPPENPRYRLKRVPLSREEEVGYYYGFSNEGLWPLCHLAHTRPIFRLSDWQQYSDVNRKFAEAIPEEALGDDSLFLVQDYHFALLPRMLQARAARQKSQNQAKIGLFWHIPWPNPEAFGICPWSRELLHGMLGSDVIGFHTQYHCNNFLETCNRYLEARIDLENFSVTMENHVTQVRAFPIGIDTAPVRLLSDLERDELKARYGITAPWVAVGVDRIDYTKGIVERVEAVERFLEKNPQYVGKFSLVQMGSPSRTHIPAYQALHEQLNAVVDRVNGRFSRDGYRPIIFLAEHHEWSDIQFFYQLGDICMVTSLHDGMNLVAKEYVWCQRPDRGTLILSKFTGASRELTEAFIVNPYSIEEMADAIAQALTLSADERSRRMTAMKEKVQTRSAYKWAAELIEALVKKDDRTLLPPLEPLSPAEAPYSDEEEAAIAKRRFTA